MAEVVGTLASALTIAALFKACVDAFDLLQAVRHQESDYNRLVVKFNIEKCRLYTWGQMMRLTSPSEHDELCPLDSFQFRDLVIQILETLHELFNDSLRIKERYGCREATVLAIDSSEEVDLTISLAAAFSHYQSGSHNRTMPKLGQKARWVIRDRKKFAELVSEIKELVDGLQEVTKSIAPIILQESAMTNRITTITEVDTLQLVSEACEEDHPIFSHAASLKSEILSMPDTRRAEIEAWLADETTLLDPDMTELENMDMPELKHHMLSLLKQRQQLEKDYSALIRVSADHLYDDPQALLAKAKRDNTSLKVISLLTLIYLPGTFVTSMMGTSLFETSVSYNTEFWMYCGMTVPLTATTVAMYWLMRQRSQNNWKGKTLSNKSRIMTPGQLEGGLSSNISPKKRRNKSDPNPIATGV